MRRDTLLLALGIAALGGIFAWALLSRPSGPGEPSPEEPSGMTAEERRIQDEIDEANRCETAADCALVEASVCPFGCYVHVHASEAARIEALLKGYRSTCMYSCIQYPGVDCVAGRCETRL